MKRTAQNQSEETGALVTGRGLSLVTPGGRPLFRDLNLTLDRTHVALLGRNGVGKSTLLQVLAGVTEPHHGQVVSRTDRLLVPQDLTPRAAGPGLSRGELRKAHLLAAKLRRPGMLLLDEPTQDLDLAGVDWLMHWLAHWPAGLLLVSHHRALLRRFHHFFLVAESGCQYFPGTFAELEAHLERTHDEEQKAYLRNLHVLSRRQHRNQMVTRRRERKKNLGRLHEEARTPSRSQLKGKKGYAQVTQGRAAKTRKARLAAVTEWARETRRALAVTLPLDLVMPRLPEEDSRDLITLDGVSAAAEGRTLFEDLSLRLARHRVAVTGPNGSGKTTLLRIMLGQQRPALGSATRRLKRIGSIAQGAADWMSDDSLLRHLADHADTASPQAVAQLVTAHRFPLALAERPLRSLSPGERVRAALICLCQRSPAPELLVLDEPTSSLDFAATSALRTSLAAWPGGLIVASHDRELLASIGIERQIELGAAAPASV